MTQRKTSLHRLLPLSLLAACGASGDAAPASSTVTAGTPSNEPVASRPAPAASNASADAGAADAAATPPCPSNGSWSSLVPGPGQVGFDATLAASVERYDRLHDALFTKATGLAGSLQVTSDPAQRAKIETLLSTPWAPTDTDPTDDLLQYTGLDPMAFVTSWGMGTGMYAGTELAADAFRYGVLRDRGGDCTAVARARKMLDVGLDALHVVVSITGRPGSIARGIARADLPGDGAAVVTPLFDSAGKALPAEKDNGTWRADNSGLYPNLIWIDSCSRDMLFGWTMGAASIWEVIKNDPTFDAAKKARLQSDMKAVLDGLRIVRAGGRDLELWDADNRPTFHGFLHESSADRVYALTNGPAALMALGQVAALVSIVDDASSKAYLSTLVAARGLPDAIAQSLALVGLSGDQANHSGYNMLFLTGWLAHRYVGDGAARGKIKSGLLTQLYSPLFGEKPSDWKQSLYDFIAATASGDGWLGAPVKKTFDAAAVANGLSSLVAFRPAPLVPPTVENCDAAESASGLCTLSDGVTTVKVKTVDGALVANKAIPMALRPPSNFYWRSDPHLVNGAGSPNAFMPGSDLRVAYWLGRYVRVAP